MSFELPPDYWRTEGIRDWENYAESWEKQLRKAVATQPDPMLRFTKWLDGFAHDGFRSSPRLTFYEQPYLRWAENVERVYDSARKVERMVCISELSEKAKP